MNECSHPQKCPYCDFMASNMAEELAHMEANHRDVIESRLSEAGISVEDYRQGPDLPSYLTLSELHTVMMFATKFAQEQSPHEMARVMIGIHVRDRGTASPMPAPWIEFEVGAKKYAMWRHNRDLYEVGPDGAVADDPIHRND